MAAPARRLFETIAEGILSSWAAGEPKRSPNDMTIAELESKIRDFINSARRQSVLLRDPAAWNRLCSSLDVIGDTELAFAAYPNLCNDKGEGESYVIVYGILQAFLLQQDAAKNISDVVLNVKVKLPRELQRIRQIRNNAAGHPANEKENGIAKSSFIHRCSISPANFTLMTVYSSEDCRYQTRNINIPELIGIQRQYLGEVLQSVITELERQEMAHKEEHRDRKVRSVFPPTIHYYFEKIFEASRGGSLFCMGAPHLNLLEECLGKFKSELESRGEWGIYDSIDYHMELVSYPLDELKDYFADPAQSKLNEKDAYIFIKFVSGQFDALMSIAEEIDEEYESGN